MCRCKSGRCAHKPHPQRFSLRRAAIAREGFVTLTHRCSGGRTTVAVEPDSISGCVALFRSQGRYAAFASSATVRISGQEFESCGCRLPLRSDLPPDPAEESGARVLWSSTAPDAVTSPCALLVRCNAARRVLRDKRVRFSLVELFSLRRRCAVDDPASSRDRPHPPTEHQA